MMSSTLLIPSETETAACTLVPGSRKRCFARGSALLVLALLVSPVVTARTVQAATTTASASMSVSAVVIGGCTATLAPTLPGGVHVGCPAPVPYSVHVAESNAVPDAVSRQVVEVQY